MLIHYEDLFLEDLCPDIGPDDDNSGHPAFVTCRTCKEYMVLVSTTCGRCESPWNPQHACQEQRCSQ